MSDRNIIIRKLNNFEKKYNLDISTISETTDLQRMKKKIISKLIRKGYV